MVVKTVKSTKKMIKKPVKKAHRQVTASVVKSLFKLEYDTWSGDDGKGEWYEGYSFPNQNRGSYACPFFDEKNAKKLLKDMYDTNGYHWTELGNYPGTKYSQQGFPIYPENVPNKVIRDYLWNHWSTENIVTIIYNGKTVKVYPIGTFDPNFAWIDIKTFRE